MKRSTFLFLIFGLFSMPQFGDQAALIMYPDFVRHVPANPAVLAAIYKFQNFTSFFPERAELLGCSYNGTFYRKGDSVPYPQRCLNCTCFGPYVTCSMRVCPPLPDIPSGCFAAREEDKCCPHVICGGIPFFHSGKQLVSNKNHEPIIFPEVKGEPVFFATERGVMAHPALPIYHYPHLKKSPIDEISSPISKEGNKYDEPKQIAVAQANELAITDNTETPTKDTSIDESDITATSISNAMISSAEDIPITATPIPTVISVGTVKANKTYSIENTTKDATSNTQHASEVASDIIADENIASNYATPAATVFSSLETETNTENTNITFERETNAINAFTIISTNGSDIAPTQMTISAETTLLAETSVPTAFPDETTNTTITHPSEDNIMNITSTKATSYKSPIPTSAIPYIHSAETNSNTTETTPTEATYEPHIISDDAKHTAVNFTYDTDTLDITFIRIAPHQAINQTNTTTEEKTASDETSQNAEENSMDSTSTDTDDDFPADNILSTEIPASLATQPSSAFANITLPSENGTTDVSSVIPYVYLATTNDTTTEINPTKVTSMHTAIPVDTVNTTITSSYGNIDNTSTSSVSYLSDDITDENILPSDETTWDIDEYLKDSNSTASVSYLSDVTTEEKIVDDETTQINENSLNNTSTVTSYVSVDTNEDFPNHKNSSAENVISNTPPFTISSNATFTNITLPSENDTIDISSTIPYVYLATTNSTSTETDGTEVTSIPNAISLDTANTTVTFQYENMDATTTTPIPYLTVAPTNEKIVSNETILATDENSKDNTSTTYVPYLSNVTTEEKTVSDETIQIDENSMDGTSITVIPFVPVKINEGLPAHKASSAENTTHNATSVSLSIPPSSEFSNITFPNKNESTEVSSTIPYVYLATINGTITETPPKNVTFVPAAMPIGTVNTTVTFQYENMDNTSTTTVPYLTNVTRSAITDEKIASNETTQTDENSMKNTPTTVTAYVSVDANEDFTPHNTSSDQSTLSKVTSMSNDTSSSSPFTNVAFPSGNDTTDNSSTIPNVYMVITTETAATKVTSAPTAIPVDTVNTTVTFQYENMDDASTANVPYLTDVNTDEKIVSDEAIWITDENTMNSTSTTVTSYVPVDVIEGSLSQKISSSDNSPSKAKPVSLDIPSNPPFANITFQSENDALDVSPTIPYVYLVMTNDTETSAEVSSVPIEIPVNAVNTTVAFQYGNMVNTSTTSVPHLSDIITQVNTISDETIPKDENSVDSISTTITPYVSIDTNEDSPFQETSLDGNIPFDATSVSLIFSGNPPNANVTLPIENGTSDILYDLSYEDLSTTNVTTTEAIPTKSAFIPNTIPVDTSYASINSSSEINTKDIISTTNTPYISVYATDISSIEVNSSAENSLPTVVSVPIDKPVHLTESIASSNGKNMTDVSSSSTTLYVPTTAVPITPVETMPDTAASVSTALPIEIANMNESLVSEDSTMRDASFTSNSYAPINVMDVPLTLSDDDSMVLVNSDADRLHDTGEDMFMDISEGCAVNGTIYGDGSAMLSNNFCEHCFCIRGKKTCLKPQCQLVIDGCEPIYDNPYICCPSRYDCSKKTPDDTTTMKPPTVNETTYELQAMMSGRSTVRVLSAECKVNGKVYLEGEIVPDYMFCHSCYCSDSGVICDKMQCSPTLDGCEPIIPAGYCCAIAYRCGHDSGTGNNRKETVVRQGSHEHKKRRIMGGSTLRRTYPLGELYDENDSESSTDSIRHRFIRSTTRDEESKGFNITAYHRENDKTMNLDHNMSQSELHSQNDDQISTESKLSLLTTLSPEEIFIGYPELQTMSLEGLIDTFFSGSEYSTSEVPEFIDAEPKRNNSKQPTGFIEIYDDEINSPAPMNLDDTTTVRGLETTGDTFQKTTKKVEIRHPLVTSTETTSYQDKIEAHTSTPNTTMINDDTQENTEPQLPTIQNSSSGQSYKKNTVAPTSLSESGESIKTLDIPTTAKPQKDVEIVKTHIRINSKHPSFNDMEEAIYENLTSSPDQEETSLLFDGYPDIVHNSNNDKGNNVTHVGYINIEAPISVNETETPKDFADNITEISPGEAKYVTDIEIQTEAQGKDLQNSASGASQTSTSEQDSSKNEKKKGSRIQDTYIQSRAGQGYKVIPFVAKDALKNKSGKINSTVEHDETEGLPDMVSDFCFIRGRIYMNGEKIEKLDPCHLCRCFYGRELCQIQKCPSPPNCIAEKVPGFCCPRFTCGNNITKELTEIKSANQGQLTGIKGSTSEIHQANIAGKPLATIFGLRVRQRPSQRPTLAAKVNAAEMDSENAKTEITNTTPVSSNMMVTSTSKIPRIKQTIISKAEAKKETPEPEIPDHWGRLKISGCNIYGKFFKIDEQVEILSSPCSHCICTANGVECNDIC